MEQKFVTINSLRFAYTEVNVYAKNAIFFIHGNSGSSNTWLKQLSDTNLSDNYRLVAFDLPAHGSSDASLQPDTDYSLIGLGKIIADAISLISDSKSYIIVGFSLGSNVLAETLNWLKSADGLVLVGSSVVGGKYTPNDVYLSGVDATAFFSDNASDEQIEAFASNLSESLNVNDKETIVNDYKAVKPGFRPGFIKTVMENKLSDEINLLSVSNVPAAVVFGANEKIANPDYLNNAPFSIWKDKVFKIANAGHTAHVDQPEIFNQLLVEYAENRFCK